MVCPRIRPLSSCSFPSMRPNTCSILAMCCDLSSLEMSPLRSLPHLPIQFAILKSRYPAWSLGSRGAESRSESTWRVRLAPHPHPIKRRFLYGNTRPGSTTTPRLGDLRPGMCSWTRSHLVWRVRPPPSRFGGSRSAGSPNTDSGPAARSRTPRSTSSRAPSTRDILAWPLSPRGRRICAAIVRRRLAALLALSPVVPINTAPSTETFPRPHAIRDTFETPLRCPSHARSISQRLRRVATSRCTSAAAPAHAASSPSRALGALRWSAGGCCPSRSIRCISRYVQRLLDRWFAGTSSVMGYSSSHFGLRGHRGLRLRSATSLEAVR